MTRPLSSLLVDIEAGHVVCDIGQVSKKDRAALDRLVRAGSIVKWRGRWYPVAGASFGLGPMKSCYALLSTKQWLLGE